MAIRLVRFSSSLPRISDEEPDRALLGFCVARCDGRVGTNGNMVFTAAKFGAGHFSSAICRKGRRDGQTRRMEGSSSRSGQTCHLRE